MPCEKGCTYSVHAFRDNPDDPAYPIVVCPFCMTRWYGHRDDQAAKPLNPKLPPALRDAIILDQAEHAFEILEQELGYTKEAIRPNGLLGASANIEILPDQSAQITARAYGCDEFTPTHFVTGVGGFRIDDISANGASVFLQAGSFPSEAFRVNVTSPDLVLRPGESIGDAYMNVVVSDGYDHLPLACSAFRWPRALPRESPLVVTVTNVSDAPAMFSAWFLGTQRSFDRAGTRLL